MSSNAIVSISEHFLCLSVSRPVVAPPRAERWRPQFRRIARRQNVRSFVVLALAMLSQYLQGQMCIPLTRNKIPFSYIIDTKAGDAASHTDDKWVLSDQSVRYLANPSTVPYMPPEVDHDKWILPGRLQSQALVGDTLWIGTTDGVVRYRVNEPDIPVKLSNPQSANGKPDTIDHISTAFDMVLLSGPNGVYRYSGTNSTQADHTTLPPGRAYGDGPYWWVTASDVYILPKDLSVGNSVLHDEVGIEPIAAGGYLWFPDKKEGLIAISGSGVTHPVEKISGEVSDFASAPMDDAHTLAARIWVATKEGLWRISVDHSGGSNNNVTVQKEQISGQIAKLLLLKDRLFYSLCSAIDSGSDGQNHCSTIVYEVLIENGKLQPLKNKAIASSAGTNWILDSAGATLYVPTQERLRIYTWKQSAADSAPPPRYDYSTSFVQLWGPELLLGSALTTQKQPKSTTDGPQAPLTDKFADLCRFVPKAKLIVKLQGEGFGWYFNFFGEKILVGSELRVSPQVNLFALDPGILKICPGSCEKDDWQNYLPSPASSDLFTIVKLEYLLRDGNSQDKQTYNDEVLIISGYLFWITCGVISFISASALLIYLAGRDDSRTSKIARKLLFQVLSDSAWVAWINLPVQIATYFETGLWWFVRPILIQGSNSAVKITETDEAVVSETSRKDDDEVTIVIYDCLQDETYARASSISKIVATDSLKNVRSWRLPVTVRLGEMQDGDMKKALLQMLQPARLENSTLADRLLQSRRLILLFLGSEQAIGSEPSEEKDGVTAILQAARSQASRSVIISPVVPAWKLSFIPKVIKSAAAAASSGTENEP
jgi:hypothetical protein